MPPWIEQVEGNVIQDGGKVLSFGNVKHFSLNPKRKKYHLRYERFTIMTIANWGRMGEGDSPEGGRITSHKKLLDIIIMYQRKNRGKVLRNYCSELAY